MKKRDKITAIVASTGLVALVAGIVIYGVAPGSSKPILSDIGAWLSNADGSVTHVNGLTGTVDGAVALTDASGHQLEVSQEGGTVVVVDQTTGLVSRIDPAQIAVGQSQDYGHTDLVYVAGKDTAYIQVPSKGLVQQVDPMTLALIGQPLSLPAPTGRAGVDRKGTLWVPLPEQGTAMPVTNGAAGVPVSVGSPKDPLVLTMAGGTPVVTNSRSGVVTVIDPESADGQGGQGQRDQLTVNLPPKVKSSTVQTPKATDGATVPMVGSGTLTLVNTGTGTLTALELPKKDKLGEPQTLGAYVYIPDESRGTLIVFNTASGKFEDDIKVSGKPGRLTVMVKDGLLWVNDASGNSAVVIGPDKSVHHISKKTEPSKQPTKQPSKERPDPQPTDEPKPTEKPDEPTEKPTEKPDPQAPGTVTATSGSGIITVGFAPAPGASHYTLDGAPTGASVSPAQVPGSGQPFQFVVRGGECSKTYSFKVVAHYPGKALSSPASTAVRPCIPPGSPRNVKAQAVQHGAKVTWSAPSDLGSDHVGYRVFWNDGQARSTGYLSAPKHDIGGLTNFKSYRIEVEAANESGTSRKVRVNASLIGPEVYSDTYPPGGGGHTDIRSAPNTSSSIIGTADNQAVTAICRTKGEYVSGGDTWAKVKWNGGTGYIHDGYLKNDDKRNLWSCT